MKITDPGHAYSLDVYDGEGEINAVFMKRIGEKFPGNEGNPHPGTNCQEYLRALIDRVKYLENQDHSPENLLILRMLRLSIFLFEFRAARRKGKSMTLSQDKFDNIENIPTCKICGHISFACEHVK